MLESILIVGLAYGIVDPSMAQIHSELPLQQVYLDTPPRPQSWIESGTYQHRPASQTSQRRHSSQSPPSQSLIPRRDKTPIRHHRPSISRTQTHGRSDLLYAYATDQSQIQNQTLQPLLPFGPSHSAPATPQIYPMSNYTVPTAGQGSYFDPTNFMTPATSSRNPSSTTDYSSFPPGQDYTGYYPHGRLGSQSSTMSIPSIEPLYSTNPPQQDQNDILSGSMAGSFPPIQTPLESSHGGEAEVSTSRPRPQCWDHGCNGRQFSTFSNLLRHQREKSGSAMKAICPHCGTEFTRTTARNGHLFGGKCKGRNDFEGSKDGSEH